MAKSDDTTQVSEQTQQSSTAPWAEAQPLLKDLISKYSGLSTDVSPDQGAALSKILSATGSIPNFGSSGVGALEKLFSRDTSPQVGMLTDAFGGLQKNIGGTASGAELDPYKTPGFSDAINTMTGDITDRIKGVYAGAGRDPSGAGSFAGSLGRGLTEGIAPVIAGQFNQNKANQMTAADRLFGGAGTTAAGVTGLESVPLNDALTALGAVPSVSGAFTNPGATQLNAANTAFSQPWTNLAQLLGPATTLGGMGGQSSGTSMGTSTTSVPQNTTSNVIGGASAAIGLLSLLSDERAKDDIEPVGKLDDGQDVVRFRYKGDPVVRIGLLAGNVAKFAPHAVGRAGMLNTVDYGKATERAAEIRRAA